MSRNATVLAVSSLLEALLLLDLVNAFSVSGSAAVWGLLHVLLVVAGGFAFRELVQLSVRHDASEDEKVSGSDAPELKNEKTAAKEVAQPNRIALFAVLVALLVPGIGLAGVSLAILHGYKASMARSYVPDYWQLTPVASLPFVAPQGRKLRSVDSRGFVEHLLYSVDDEDVYRKVLASGSIRTSLAIDTLKQAMQHRDERVRLTAYKMLDRKVTVLNRQVQHLEQQVDGCNDTGTADSWLQIASSYWELITLEGGEVVARRQLLSKASAAAIKVVGLQPGNRNAHLVLGRVSLAQGDTRRATVALERSQALGMPADKVLPYLAECAYMRRDFTQVQQLLAGLDRSLVAYPPLSHVVGYWA